MSDAHEKLVEAMEAVLRSCDEQDTPVNDDGYRYGWNLPEAIRVALQTLAERHGVERLVWHRPGCWESAVVLQLVGESDHFGLMTRMAAEARAAHGTD